MCLRLRLACECICWLVILLASVFWLVSARECVYVSWFGVVLDWLVGWLAGWLGVGWLLGWLFGYCCGVTLSSML